MSAHGAGSAPTKNWDRFYGERCSQSRGRYATEWVVRTLAGGNYPNLRVDKSRYAGSRILDLGCGDGRNLPLLVDLGFEVYATEISATVVHSLESLARELHWPVRFAVGTNTRLPFADSFFDYMLCSSSCYYLDGATTWPTVRTELGRVIKPGGWLVANFPDEHNAVLRKSERQPDGSLLITNDPFGIRNGIRFMIPKDLEDIPALLGPQFGVVATGSQNDDYYGLRVSGYLVVAQRN